MGWHIIKRLLQAVPVLLVTLSRIEYQESNPASHFVNPCNSSFVAILSRRMDLWLRSLGYARDGVRVIRGLNLLEI